MNTHKKILLVEDNPGDAELIVRVLRRHGVTNHVDLVTDGAQALDYLFRRGAYAEQREDPVVVVLDLKLPKVDGFEILSQIRAADRTRLLPVVILTSSDHEDDVVRGYSMGANSYVRKPVDFGEFARTIEQLGLYWLLLNENPFACRGQAA